MSEILLLQWLSKFVPYKEDFKKVPKKIWFMFLVLLACSFLYQGCAYGASPEFMEDLQQFSEEQIKPVSQNILRLDRVNFAVLMGKEKDAYKNVSESAFNRLKEQRSLELRSICVKIEENYNAVKGANNGKIKDN